MPKCSLKIEKSTPCALPCIVFATTGTAASGDNAGANPPNGHARPDGAVRGEGVNFRLNMPSYYQKIPIF